MSLQTLETHRKVGDQSKIDITGDEFKDWVCAKWDIAPEGRMKRDVTLPCSPKSYLTDY